MTEPYRFQVGDRVERIDPYFHAAFMRVSGIVIAVNGDSTLARVHWDGDTSPDVGYRGVGTIKLCD